MEEMSSTSSFILELPVRITPHDAHILDLRLDAGRQLYNACLGEALRRLDLMRESKVWKEARTCRGKDERRKLFYSIQEKYGFSDYEIQALAIETKNACWIGDHLDTHVCQKIGTRAFRAVERYAYGKRGRPRFKSKGRFRSLEGKNNAAGIRFRDGCTPTTNTLVWGCIEWRGLELKVLFDRKDKWGVEAHGLSCETKYVRLVRKLIHGKVRWYAQLVQKGRPKQKSKNRIGQDIVGLDIGPSTIAAVGGDDAFLVPFCAELEPIERKVRLLQRALDRSRRCTNPENYNSDGTVKKGPKKWNLSKRYIRLKARLAEDERRLAQRRKCLHGELANRVLAMGNQINTEQLSYKGFQREWGKSVGFRAPGMFVEKLRRKAESAGGAVYEFSASDTRLSQLCHGCDRIEKKPLSQRWHKCECGIGPVQRDLYSAYLAKYVKENSLDTRQAKEAWPGAEPLLRRAVSGLNQTANGKLRFASFGLSRRQSGSHVKDESVYVKAADVVGEGNALSESRRGAYT